MKISLKQRVFIQHYLGDCWMNATRAAAKAGYSYPNKAGPRLIQSPKIKPIIAAYDRKAVRAELNYYKRLVPFGFAIQRRAYVSPQGNVIRIKSGCYRINGI